MDTRVVRLLAGLIAGGLTVFVIDRFFLPGTLQAGLVGVAVSVATLSYATRGDGQKS